MKTLNVENRPFQMPAEKEKLFQALEIDEKLFKETLEVMLTLVISDPKLTNEVANLIGTDFRYLYLVIMQKIAEEKSNDSSMECCKDLLKN